MTKYWIGVASRDHVRTGTAGGFCQLCHGKAAPLRRLKAGDRIIYYSPRERMRDGAPIQAFTAIGEVASGEPEPHDMGGGFVMMLWLTNGGSARSSLHRIEGRARNSARLEEIRARLHGRQQ
jgi:EVE domain